MTEITKLETQSMDEIARKHFELTDELRRRDCSAIPSHITDADIITEVHTRNMEFDDVFDAHDCSESCDHIEPPDEELLIEDALQDEHQLRSGGPLFGIQLAYEHACAGNAEAAAQALKEAVPALPNIRHQRQMPAPLPATTPAPPSATEIETAAGLGFFLDA